MRILVDILHPAHVHFFKNAIWEWKKRGDQVLVTARDKDVTIRLLKAYGIDYIKISKIGKGMFGLAKELVSRNYRLFKIAKNFKPDVLIGVAGVSIAPVGKILRMPSIVFTNNEYAKLSNRITFPFADVIYTPDCFKGTFGKKHKRYNGNHELAYLHPRYFKADENILKSLGLTDEDPFFLLRFISWEAAHDIGIQGINHAEKVELIHELEKYGKVFVSSESPLPPELKIYRIPLSPEQIHSLLCFARLCITEGATMASEAAVLGVPSIYINPVSRGYIEDEAGYGLLYEYKSFKQARDKILELARSEDSKTQWQMKKKKFLEDKIDMTDFVIRFVERYFRNGEKVI